MTPALTPAERAILEELLGPDATAQDLDGVVAALADLRRGLPDMRRARSELAADPAEAQG